MFGKKKIAMAVAEFWGTALLTLVVLSVGKSTIGIPYFVALAAGLTVAVMVLMVGAVSGAQLNPALTIGLWTARKIKTLPAIAYVALQLAGAAVAYWGYRYLVNFNGTWPNMGHFTARVMLAEAVGAFVFAFAWAAAVHQKYDWSRFATTVGVAFALGVLVASVASSGFINPAVALGVRSWGWGTYVLGPVVGGVVGVNLYDMLFGDWKLPVSLSGATTRSSRSKKINSFLKR